IEMEAGGVYEAARQARCPLLCVRGISDIVGFKRSPEWTSYACQTAASFVMALLRSEAIELLPRELLPSVRPSMHSNLASEEVPQLKYYLYVSDTKVEMLEPQISGNRSATDRFSRLRSVVNFLNDTGRVGTLADPREYFSGRLPMRWGPYTDAFLD